MPETRHPAEVRDESPIVVRSELSVVETSALEPVTVGRVSELTEWAMEGGNDFFNIVWGELE